MGGCTVALMGKASSRRLSSKSRRKDFGEDMLGD